MLKNENIICISSIDWDFIWQGHQEIMSTLAENGNKVLFIENTGVRVPAIRDISRIKNRVKNWFQGVSGIREIKKNLYIFSPLVLPFPYLRIATWINRSLILLFLKKWFRIIDFAHPIIWLFLPTPLSLRIIDNLISKFIIYYCIDNFRVSSGSAKKIKNSEINLLKRADLVFVTSRELYNYCSNYNDEVHFFPFAVNFHKFEEVRLSKDSIPEELKDIKKPIVGYIGGVHKWVDLNLIKVTALKFPQYSFVFVGPIQTDISSLAELENVYFLEKKDHKSIPNFIKNFDVCIVPYLITEYTKNVYPTKLNEYHAMGKAVVSTDLPEIANFNTENDNLVLIGRTYQEFADCISKGIGERSDSTIQRRISSAQKNSWSITIEEMSSLIKNGIDKKSQILINWRESLVRLYKLARRKMLRIALAFFMFYFVIFYTPLVWFLASPLKISQMPSKADCIVVFAGGVGESGKAEQGYEERVKYAVELYKKGYAQHMIFSSGYMFVFKEPLVMKVLAVSLGVPEEAIILEDKASGTYQNVKFTIPLLLANGWKKILLVSSPYHMKRSLLVFNKINGNITVVCTPVKNSAFYAHPERSELGRRNWKRIRFRQIKGIIHEYLGIIYYWKEGYI